VPQKKFNNTVNTLGPRLLNFAAKQIGSMDIAKDLVQDTFIVYLDKREQVYEGKEKSFLFKVLSNKILDHFKLKKNNIDFTTVHLGEADNSGTYEAKQIVNMALLYLKPLDRQLITLRDLEGYNYEEIAEILDISLGQVKVYLFRARKRLKEEVIRLDLSYEQSYK
jgi:RNA polymerase sigma-70 factor (ECF subfamily)